MKIAYADPPYIGQSKRHYEDHPDYAGEVDHMQLLIDLKHGYPDGWALSCSSPSLQEILGFCALIDLHPRIGAWVKTFGAFKRGVRPAYMWEPVLFVGGRNPPWYPHPPPELNGKQTTPKDFVACSITPQARADRGQAPSNSATGCSGSWECSREMSWSICTQEREE